MLTNSDETETRIEKAGLAPIIVRRGLSRLQDGTEYYSYDREGRKFLSQSIDRAIKGYCMFTYLPDDTIVESYGDSTQNSFGVRHVFKRHDFSVVSVDSFGQVDIISSNRRSAMNEAGGKSLIGKDDDYCKGIFSYGDVFNQFGVFHAFVDASREDLMKPCIITVDPTFQHQYLVNSNLELQMIENQFY